MVVGILAVQGNFTRHQAVLHDLGVDTLLVRTAEDLALCDRIVLPGGESSVFLHHLSTELLTTLKDFCENHPVFATCAGLILLAAHVVNPVQKSLGLLDVTVMRNAYGRQTESFFTDSVQLTPPGQAVLGNSAEEVLAVSGAFIRAPLICTIHSDKVKTLAFHSENPVLVQQKNIIAATFHPELAPNERRVHKAFLLL
jgi:5'-phosphate synthase pdxT subunit